MDGRLQSAARCEPELRSVLELRLTDDEADQVGLSCGGSARLLVQPATDIDAAGWAALGSDEPVCLITELDGDQVGASAVFTAATIDDGRADLRSGRAAAVQPRGRPDREPRSGGRHLALAGARPGRGWRWADRRGSRRRGRPARVVGPRRVRRARCRDAAVAAVDGLSHADALVVLSHDPETGGRALLTALTGGGAGYVGRAGLGPHPGRPVRVAGRARCDGRRRGSDLRTGRARYRRVQPGRDRDRDHRRNNRGAFGGSGRVAARPFGARPPGCEADPRTLPNDSKQPRTLGGSSGAASLILQETITHCQHQLHCSGAI